MKIYVATHKKMDTQLPDGYIPFLVGSNSNVGEEFYLKDNTGDNISYKNSNYCELTGIYWIWKNSNEDIVGLEHYRRFLVHSWNISRGISFLDDKTIKFVLAKYDLILPVKIHFNKSLLEYYGEHHHLKDLLICKEIISEHFPDYVNSFDIIMSKNTMHPLNMFISNKKVINPYFEWIFKIFELLEDRIDISEYDNYQSRVYGFLSERLFNVWIHKNNLKVKCYPFVNVEANEYRNTIDFKYKMLKNDLLYLKSKKKERKNYEI